MTAAANTATIQYNHDTGDLYLETYLIDALGPNARGWGVSPSTIKARAEASLNHPLTMYRSQQGIFDHPISEYGADDHATNRKLEQKYSIGFATKIREVASNLYHAVYKITNQDAKRYLLNLLQQKGIERIGLFTSPGIIRPATEDRSSIQDFTITHNAIVSIPANHPNKAAVKAACHTATQDCTHLTASMTSSADGKCEYCMEAALASYLSSINATEATFDNSIMSNNIPDTTSKPDGVIEQPHQQPTAAEPNRAPVPAAGGYIPKEDKLLQQQEQPKPGASATEAEDWKAKYEALKLEKEQSNKTLEDRINEIERRRELDNRGRSVLDIFYNFGVRDILSSKEDFDKKLEYYVNSKYSEDEIADLVQAMIVKHQVESGQLVQNTASDALTTTPCSQRQESASSSTSHSLVTEKASQSSVAAATTIDTSQLEMIKDIFANADLQASKYLSSLRQRGGTS